MKHQVFKLVKDPIVWLAEYKPVTCSSSISHFKVAHNLFPIKLSHKKGSSENILTFLKWS